MNSCGRRSSSTTQTSGPATCTHRGYRLRDPEGFDSLVEAEAKKFAEASGDDLDRARSQMRDTLMNNGSVNARTSPTAFWERARGRLALRLVGEIARRPRRVLHRADGGHLRGAEHDRPGLAAGEAIDADVAGSQGGSYSLECAGDRLWYLWPSVGRTPAGDLGEQLAGGALPVPVPANKGDDRLGDRVGLEHRLLASAVADR